MDARVLVVSVDVDILRSITKHHETQTLVGRIKREFNININTIQLKSPLKSK